MNEALFAELLKQSSAVAILGVIGWTLWKRYDIKMKETSVDLKSLRERFENELLKDIGDLRVLIKETNDINEKMIESVEKFSDFCKNENIANRAALGKNSTVMECLVKEIKAFKNQTT